MEEKQNWFHFSEWFDRNFIYCEQTHSFTHRFYEELKKNMPEDYKGAQNIAWDIFSDMQKEFFDGKPKQEENKNGIF